MQDQLLQECKAFITNGGILSGCSFTKVQIKHHGLMEIDADEAETYLAEHRSPMFTELLFEYIDRSGKKDSEIYKKARLDRRLFSKIRSNKEYTPAKNTIIALCLALELNRIDVDKLLSSAGFGLSRAEEFDLIIAFCIEKKIYNFNEVNDILVYFGHEPF